MLRLLRSDHYKFINDDPVRNHIPLEWRIADGREIYALYEDRYAEYDEVLSEDPEAIICVAYTDQIPQNEQDLTDYQGQRIAVFYTVWSYSKGAGRIIVNSVAEHIKNTKPKVERYVTLSPLTEMAERFHLSNGAKFLNRYKDCQNFEYTV